MSDQPAIGVARDIAIHNEHASGQPRLRDDLAAVAQPVGVAAENATPAADTSLPARSGTIGVWRCACLSAGRSVSGRRWRGKIGRHVCLLAGREGTAAKDGARV